MRICQLQNMSISLLIQSFCIIMLFGCAETPVAPVQKLKHDRVIKADWFKLDPRFGSTESDGKISIHPFYDIDWRLEDYDDKDPKNFRIPYFVTTPEDGKFLFDLNLYSGKLFQERVFCAQEDIWKSYKEDLFTPNFTLGLIPRTLNEKQKPQEIIIFAKGEHVPQFKEYPMNYSDVRVIGSVIIEQCESFPCSSKDNWKASQILIGVPPRDPAFLKVDSFIGLKKRVNWDYAKAMLTNMHGHHNVGGVFKPAYRVLKELGVVDTVDYFKKKSAIATPGALDDLKKLREKCVVLYEDMWTKSEEIRALKNGQTDAFQKMFKQFYTTSAKDLKVCLETVRPANILENPRRLWFFAYIQAFFIMDSHGYSYNCRESTWSLMKGDMDRCKSHQFERNFEQAINGLRLMSVHENKRYRFVEYDNTQGGSHQAIYAWINDRPQNYSCKDSKTKNTLMNLDIFPQDVVWENYLQEDIRLLR